MSKKITLRCHHDADGIVTAYFTSFGVDNAEIEIWDGDFGDTTGLKPGDYMLDMRPIQNMEGLICIDHHLPHIENRKYTLISDVVPASLIAYNLYKEECDIFEFPNLSVILFYSDLRMSGYLATKLLESVGTPAILAINRKTNKGSLRGDLALYWQDKLSKLSQYIEISGHPGFMGATLKANADAFIEELTKLLIV